MTAPNQPNPYATGGPIPPPAPTTPAPADTIPPAPKRKSRLPLVLGITGGLILLLAVLGIGIAIGGMGNDKAGTPSARDAGQTANAAPIDAGEPGVPTDEPTEQPTAGPTPRVRDFALRPKITDKECFGSAGCSVTLKVQAEYVGPALNPDDTYEVTYEIRGVEEGPQIGSFEMTGDTYEVNEEFVDTKSSKSVITIKVTSVDKVGI